MDNLNIIRACEQMQETSHQLAEIVGRYWQALPAEMPLELRQSLTEMYADVLHDYAFGQSVSSVLGFLKDLKDA